MTTSIVEPPADASRDSGVDRIVGRVLSHETTADIVAREGICTFGSVPIKDGEVKDCEGTGTDTDTGVDKLVLVHLHGGVCKELVPRMSLVRLVGRGKRVAIDACTRFTSCGIVRLLDASCCARETPINPLCKAPTPWARFGDVLGGNIWDCNTGEEAMTRAGGGTVMNCDCNVGGSCGGMVHRAGTVGEIYGDTALALVCRVGINGDLGVDLL